MIVESFLQYHNSLRFIFYFILIYVKFYTLIKLFCEGIYNFVRKLIIWGNLYVNIQTKEKIEIIIKVLSLKKHLFKPFVDLDFPILDRIIQLIIKQTTGILHTVTIHVVKMGWSWDFRPVNFWVVKICTLGQLNVCILGIGYLSLLVYVFLFL